MFCAQPVSGESEILAHLETLANSVRREVGIPVHPHGPDAWRTGDGGKGPDLRVVEK